MNNKDNINKKSNKENTSNNKKQKDNVVNKKATSANKNKEIDSFKKEIDLLKKEIEKKDNLITNLNKEIFKLKDEITTNNNAFAMKAQSFAKDAQIQINKFKDEYISKHKNEISEINKYKSEGLLRDIIDSILNLEIAVSLGSHSKNNEIKSYVQGFKMIINQIIHAFENHNITLIIPNIDDEYDPDIHDVMSGKGNKIKSVKKYGVKLHDRVIKPSLIELK